MSAHATPAIPPRPSRSSNPTSSPPKDMPWIPPRPIARRYEKSQSPVRDSYAPSPLNSLPVGSPPIQKSVKIHEEQDQRPPSVAIPSLGEEGREYEDLDVGSTSSEAPDPQETRTVASDLQLYAPRPSLPQSSATARMQAVTRTDSSQPIGRSFALPTPSDQEAGYSSSYNSQSSSSLVPSPERRRSSHIDEHGIPEIGQRVPMYPNAGDVQAPSAPPDGEPVAGRGRRRHHNRTRSGREISLPPGSYGLHGHGINTSDRFERAWYEKHPDEYAKEEHQYPPGLGHRPDSALSSDALNKLVRSSARTGSGLGRF